MATSRYARCSAWGESRRLPVNRQMTMIDARHGGVQPEAEQGDGAGEDGGGDRDSAH